MAVRTILLSKRGERGWGREGGREGGGEGEGERVGEREREGRRGEMEERRDLKHSTIIGVSNNIL